MTLTHAVAPDLESVAGAQARLLEGVGALAAETVGLDQALGRILAEAVASQSEMPGFDNSAMDGYAVRAHEIAAATATVPVRLPVAGESRAGSVPGALEPGTAMRIMTGAPMPDGADTVVRQEDTSREGATVLIQVATALGTSVRLRGADMRAGTTVLHPGQVLRSIDIAVAAALGRARLLGGRATSGGPDRHGRRTGPRGHGPGAGATRRTRTLRCSPRRFAKQGAYQPFSGSLAIQRNSLRTLLETAASSHLIVSSAGVSVGDHDWVREVVTEIGEVSTWRVAMRPGKPVLTGRIGDAIFIGLPGNPVSSSVTFELFARPVIRRMQGAQELHRRRIRVRLGEAMSKPADLETYARAVLSVATHDDLPHAHSAGDQGSSMLHSLTSADCLLILPVGSDVVDAGTVVSAIPLR